MKIKIRVLIPLCLCTATLFAQKLPKIQEASLRIPDNVKIDGKSTEWDNKFQAYNNSTDIFYTIANDDEKLYLIIQATDPIIIRKIIAGGITLTINSTGDKKDKGVAITYPIFEKKNWPIINWKNKPKVTNKTTDNGKLLDSFMYAGNKQLADKSKEIKVFGIKGLDTLISVYNEDGIRAASLFDHQIAYTYELAVPLKYLALSGDDQNKFSYNIRVNGSESIEGATVKHIEGGTLVTGGNGSISAVDAQYMLDPTDFTGSYILAKK